MRVSASWVSLAVHALAVSDACTRMSLTWESVRTLADFNALSIAFISSRWARTKRSSNFQSSVVMLLSTMALWYPMGARPVFAQIPRMVTLDITAINERGEFVGDLRGDELQVYDNGRRQKIALFLAGKRKSSGKAS